MGDTCAARCTFPNGKPIVVVTVYISVNQNVTDIMEYISKTLLAYTECGSKLLGKPYLVLPLILGGDFNIDTDKDDEGLILVQFLKSELNFDFVSGKGMGTTCLSVWEAFRRFLESVLVKASGILKSDGMIELFGIKVS
ncbi:hypothetical protein TNCV_2046411 [Trichonephila clavipes]|uniref:Endonuclease/exonuclease/phosphatase domain-containing protein n=1 Tax=Trichonephila clavipes TaxID=2585209 RepID=A0A8X6SUW7_TRICX|nr:hypothetical protein TNCV_2046411 [Trichonephila clavipes]